MYRLSSLKLHPQFQPFRDLTTAGFNEDSATTHPPLVYIEPSKWGGFLGGTLDPLANSAINGHFE